MPGGLSEMILVGGAMGGDERKISLSHAARILIVVLIVPFAFRWLYPNSVGGGLSPFSNDGALSLPDAVILIACGVIGYLLARLARIPAAAIVGPMIASAIVHLSGWTAARPPVELIAFAQVVMGTAVGCRFTGTKAREVLDALRNALFGTAALLTVTLIVAGVLQNLTGLPLASLILAFSPGGLAEMSLIALSLEVDPAFVSTHHIVRICLVVIFAPLAFKLLWRGK
jgi:hypothetical protein